MSKSLILLSSIVFMPVAAHAERLPRNGATMMGAGQLSCAFYLSGGIGAYGGLQWVQGYWTALEATDPRTISGAVGGDPIKSVLLDRLHFLCATHRDMTLQSQAEAAFLTEAAKSGLLAPR